MKLRAACVQLNTRQDTAAAVRTAGELVRRAAAEGGAHGAWPASFAPRRGCGDSRRHAGSGPDGAYHDNSGCAYGQALRANGHSKPDKRGRRRCDWCAQNAA